MVKLFIGTFMLMEGIVERYLYISDLYDLLLLLCTDEVMKNSNNSQSTFRYTIGKTNNRTPTHNI